MKVGIYKTVRGGVDRFAPFITEDMNLELVGIDQIPTVETLEELKKQGCEAMIYNSDHKESKAFFKTIADAGVKYVCCSCAGYDHFDLDAMKKYGLKGANVPAYSPNAISEHTVMLLLATLRHFKMQIIHTEHHIYQKAGLKGREIRNMEIGIVGAGRIGYTTMKCLSGFGPKKMLAYDPYPNDKVKELAEYVSLDKLYEECDVIIYHAVLNKENYHMVNEETIQKMKDGVVLINTSRGGIFDASAVLKGVQSGKIGALGIDVVEGEALLDKQPQFTECPDPVLEALFSHENVVYTPHVAFFTDEAERNLSQGTIENLNSYEKTGSCDKELVK